MPCSARSALIALRRRVLELFSTPLCLNSSINCCASSVILDFLPNMIHTSFANTQLHAQNTGCTFLHADPLQYARQCRYAQCATPQPDCASTSQYPGSTLTFQQRKLQLCGDCWQQCAGKV